MSFETVAAAKTEIFSMLATDADGTPHSSLTGTEATKVERVFPYEPFAGEGAAPIWITIATAGTTAEDWVIAIRVYVTLPDAKQQQDALDALMPLVEALLDDHFGPSRWVHDWVPEIKAFVAMLLLEVGREDF